MKKERVLVLIGSDPEMFLSKDGEIINAIGLVPGTKAEPLPITPEGHYVQIDNVAAEFNIPPVTTGKELHKEIKVVLDWFKAYLPEGVTPKIQASHIFKDEDLLHPDSWLFGCDPDFDAWSELQNPPPCSIEQNLRSCGGHVHVGYPNPDKETNLLIIKWMDIFLGAPSVLIDEDTRRRELYGKMGAFRHKPFGVEYRTLSNFWIQDEKLCEWIVINTNLAVEYAREGKVPKEEDFNYAKEAIEKNSKEAAERIKERYDLHVPVRETA